MEHHDFIESGILEAYAIGIATEEEQKQATQLLSESKQAKEELEEIEICLERLARYFAVEPNRKRKTEIEDQIFMADDTLENLTRHYLPEKGRYRIFQWWSVAASVAFLLATGFGWWGYQNLLNTQESLAQMKVEYELLSSENQQMYLDQQKMTSLGNYLSNEGAVQIVLSSTRKDHMKATIFWNPQTHEAWLIGSNLPPLPEGKQYQMWGIVSGKPIDAGVFDASSNGNMMVPMKPMESPSMFAVTIENQGGSKNPTMNSMCLKADL
jgi:anti-sigma-K factor RskA